MYCRFCGKEIKDDSVFCSYCGKQVENEKIDASILKNDKNESIEQAQENGEETVTDSSTKSSSGHLETSSATKEGESSLWALWLLIPLFMMFALILSVVLIVNNADSSDTNNSQITIDSKKLTRNDYEYTTSQDINSYSVTIIPKVDIKNCDVEIKLYDSDGDLIYSDTMTKTNLKEGKGYTYTFDFGFVNSLFGRKVKIDISGKRN